jgi:hypothetical protein
MEQAGVNRMLVAAHSKLEDRRHGAAQEQGRDE